MSLTTSSILNVSVLSGMAVLVLWLILNNQRIINQLTFHVLFSCLVVLFIRIVLPVEYKFTVTIPVEHILPNIRKFCTTHIFSIWGYDIQVKHLFYLAWIVECLIFLFHVLRGFFSLKRSVKIGFPTNDPMIQKAFIDAIDNPKKAKKFRLVQSKEIETPMIFGIWKPCIFLPEAKLSPKEWQYIFRHELSHYYHGDLYIKYLLTLLTVVYWWNPFVHILSKQISKVLELRTDYAVIRPLNNDERLDYASCLLNMSKQRLEKQKSNTRLAISFIGFKQFSIAQRFHFVTAESDRKKKRLSTHIVVLPILFFTLLSFCFIFEASSIKPADAEETIELTPDNAYMIKNPNGSYDIYYEDHYLGNSESGNIGVTLPIYDSKEDVP